MITVKEIITKKDLKQFVKFPFSIYKNNLYWVPPIISEELAIFDKEKNPAFDTADARFFLAYKNNTIVGRVAAIINHTEVNEQGLKKMRFGWFDFIDDVSVSEALLTKIQEIGAAHNLEYMEGPVGFSNLDKVGVLTEGFDKLGTMITWYNHSYYQKHFEAHGFVKEKEYLEWRFPFKNVNPDSFQKAQALIKRRYQLKSINFTSTKQILPYVDSMFDLFNESYSSLSSFVPISDKQKKYFKEKYINFIDPEYITYVADKDDNLVGFAVVLPSFSKALQKAKGKLFPFGIFHMLKAKKYSKDIIFYLIGIHPDYQNKGVHAVIFNDYYEAFTKKGIKNCIRTPELEDNVAIRQIWKHFDPKIVKRRRTYRKNL
ncbi:MAG: GNAT family N-acetyltransferase [Flavobacteriaceae bacterium]|nr:GNAT family N-acetyltransferase [Flavobacteriaceae bacterium]